MRYWNFGFPAIFKQNDNENYSDNVHSYHDDDNVNNEDHDGDKD